MSPADQLRMACGEHGSPIVSTGVSRDTALEMVHLCGFLSAVDCGKPLIISIHLMACSVTCRHSIASHIH